jgi:hypothetical protein
VRRLVSAFIARDFSRVKILSKNGYPSFGSSNATDVLKFGCRRVFGKIGHHQIGETIFFEIHAHSLSSVQMCHLNCRI